jgi:hypothetical protein
MAVAKYGWLSTLCRQTQILAGQGVFSQAKASSSTVRRWHAG